MKFMLLLRLTFKFFSFKLNKKKQKKNKKTGKNEKKITKKKEINKTKHFLRALPLNKVADNSYNNNNENDVADELAWNPPSGQVMLPKTLPRAAAFLLRFRLSSDACVLLVILLGSRESGGEERGNSTVGGVAAAACQTDLEALAVAVAVAVASARVAFLPLLFPFPFGTIELATPKPSQADCGRCCLLSCSEYHMPTGCPQCWYCCCLQQLHRLKRREASTMSMMQFDHLPQSAQQPQQQKQQT